MKDSLYDLTKKLFTMSDDEGKELLFNETNIYDYDRVKMMISAFVQKKESLIVKSGNKLKFDLKKNVNEVWNIMFLSNYIEQITDRSIEEVKRNITILEDNKRNYYKNRNTSKTEEEKLYWDEIINFNKISLDESKSILRSYLNAKAECAVILENKDEVEDLTFILEKLENAIQRIHTLRNVLSHKNTEFEYETQSVVINEPSRRIVGRIPKEYLSGFAEGCINTRNEDKNIALKTNAELEIFYNRYNLKIVDLNNFYYNVEPDRLALITQFVGGPDKIRNLPHQLFTCRDYELEKVFELDREYGIPISRGVFYTSLFRDKCVIDVIEDINRYEKINLDYSKYPLFSYGKFSYCMQSNLDFCFEHNIIDEGIFKFFLSTDFTLSFYPYRDNSSYIMQIISYFASNGFKVNFYEVLKDFRSNENKEGVAIYNLRSNTATSINDVYFRNILDLFEMAKQKGIEINSEFLNNIRKGNLNEFIKLIKIEKNNDEENYLLELYSFNIAVNVDVLSKINKFCNQNDINIYEFSNHNFSSFEEFIEVVELFKELNIKEYKGFSKKNIKMLRNIAKHSQFKNYANELMEICNNGRYSTRVKLERILLDDDSCIDELDYYWYRYHSYFQHFEEFKKTKYFSFVNYEIYLWTNMELLLQFLPQLEKYNFSDKLNEKLIYYFTRICAKSRLIENPFSFIDKFLSVCPELKDNDSYFVSLFRYFLRSPGEYSLNYEMEELVNRNDFLFEIFKLYNKDLVNNNIQPFNYFHYHQLVEFLKENNRDDQIDLIPLLFNGRSFYSITDNLKDIIKRYNFDLNLVSRLPDEIFGADKSLLDDMLKIHDQNMMKSLFGTNDHKLISLYSYVHSVMSTIVSPSIITNINEELEVKLSEMGYNEFSEQKWFINKLRNSVCHFRFKSDGNELNLWDTEDNVTVNFMTTISYEDLLELTRLIELSYSLEYVDYSSKGL